MRNQYEKQFVLLVVYLLFNLSTLFGNKIVIQDFNKKYGLTKNRVNCMFQDSMGFLWFGMANGLYKFDLNTFTYFNLQKNKINGFPESDIRAIIEYAPGLLLIGTYNKGLLVYNTFTEKYDSVYSNALIDFSSLYVHCLHLDKTGTIWIGTFNGVFRIKYLGKQINKFELLNRFDRSNTKLVGNEVFSIMESKKGVIWFITMSDIGYYNTLTKKIQTFATYDANSSFTFIDDQRILIGCFGYGLKMFNTETLKFEDIHIKDLSDKSQVRYVYKDSYSNIWISISNIGLILLESDLEKPKTTIVSNKSLEYSELNSNVIHQIFESKDGALWICSEEGINMIFLKKNFFESYSYYMTDHNAELPIGIRALLNSGNGFIWIGTIGGGLKKFNLSSKKYTDVPLIHQGKIIGKNIQAIIRDYKGNLWLGTEGDGVIRFSPDRNNNFKSGAIINYQIYPKSFPAQSLLNDYIMCLLEDQYNNIWIGTWNGLSLIESSELRKPDQSKAIIKNFVHNPSDSLSISNNIIMSLLEDKTGNIWVGTQEGLNKIIKTPEGYKFEHNYRNNIGTPLSEKKILVIYQSKNGNLWFSTQSGGLSFLDTKTGVFQEYNSENGFHDNIVNSISVDSLGIFWLGTNNGLCRFEPTNHTFNIYKIEDGLISNDFFYASNCKVGNKLYFGSNKGLTILNPYEINPSSFIPNLVFTDFRLFNKPVKINIKDSPLKRHISVLSDITLNYNQNNITIAFAALNYKQQDELKYNCIMEGLEADWNRLNKERKITYANLKPGHYKFKVQAFSPGHYDNSKVISLPMIIKPPFWKTTWAYITYIVVFIFIVIKTYMYFLNEEKKKHSLAIERMNAKRIHEMDLMKLQFYTNISHELRTPLTLISAPLETLMKENLEHNKIQFYYQLMLKNVQRLKRHIDQLLDMRKVEEGYLKMEWTQGDIIEFIKRIYITFENYAEKRIIKFTFQSSAKQLYTFFDADKLDKILFNLLSNAFKYTPNFGNIAVRVKEKNSNEQSYQKMTEKFLEIKISDSGIGIPKEAITNIFKAFHRVKDNRPIGSSGTGIGLSLTKELIDLYQGSISVESEINKGSVFTVHLPIYKNIPQKDVGKNNNLINYDNVVENEILGPEEQNNNINVKKSFSKPLVLIVEDNSDLRKFLSNELQNNYYIMESSNGKEGLETAISKIPDLIISDIMMNLMDGIELCRKLKVDERTSHIPLILLTARHSEEVKQNSFDIGADDYITKPFNISLLQSRIKNLIEQRQKLRKLFGKGNNFDFSAIATNKVDSQFLEKLNQIVEKNIDNPNFSPVSLASDMAMSKMQLYRKVAALTNQTVYNYIRTIRMNKAASLLATTDMQISVVALNVGYTEPSNFTKCFIRQFNQTPSEFIRANREFN